MANISKPTTLNTIWASTGTRIDPGVTKTNIGWVVQLPPYEYQNWAMNRQDTAIAHFNQHGIPEWDVVTEYQGNLSYTQGSNGFIYKCIQTHTGLDPTNTNNNLFWKLAFEEYGSVQVVQSDLNAHLANYATLSGISNIVLARANLSVYSRAEGDARYAFKGGDNATPFLIGQATNPNHAIRAGQVLSYIPFATESIQGIARISTAAESEAGADNSTIMTPFRTNITYLKKSGNLAGLTSTIAARANLELGTIATESASGFLRTVNNLSDLANLATARTNLGLGSMATEASANYLAKSDNLAGLTNQQAARNNLGLGQLATFATSGVSPFQLAAKLLRFDFSGSPSSGIIRFPNGFALQYVAVGSVNGTASAIWPVQFTSIMFGMANERSPSGWTPTNTTVWAFDQGSSSNTHGVARVRDVASGGLITMPTGTSGIIFAFGSVE